MPWSPLAAACALDRRANGVVCRVASSRLGSRVRIRHLSNFFVENRNCAGWAQKPDFCRNASHCRPPRPQAIRPTYSLTTAARASPPHAGQ
jgi:hypothetical protein